MSTIPVILGTTVNAKEWEAWFGAHDATTRAQRTEVVKTYHAWLQEAGLSVYQPQHRDRAHLPGEHGAHGGGFRSPDRADVHNGDLSGGRIMAMTNVQQNIVSELQHMAGELVSIQSRTAALSAMYANENIGGLSDADYAAIPSFAHITATELQAAAAAIAAINTALNAGAPSNWAKMLKIVERMPK